MSRCACGWSVRKIGSRYLEHIRLISTRVYVAVVKCKCEFLFRLVFNPGQKLKVVGRIEPEYLGVIFVQKFEHTNIVSVCDLRGMLGEAYSDEE